MIPYNRKKDKIYTVDAVGDYHSYDDYPAIIYNCGIMVWYSHGKIDRNYKKPAIVFNDGLFVYYDQGMVINKKYIYEVRLGNKFSYKGKYLHSWYDLPAIKTTTGLKVWYKNGKKHRDNNLPAVIKEGGSKEWWVEGLRIL